MGVRQRENCSDVTDALLCLVYILYDAVLGLG